MSDLDFLDEIDGDFTEQGVDILEKDAQLAAPDCSEDVQELLRGNSYFEYKDAFSNSMFSRLEKDVSEFDAWFNGVIQDEPKKTFSRGQYMHDYLARLIDKNYVSECKFVVIPKVDLRTKAGKADMQAALEGVCLETTYQITQDEINLIERLANDFASSSMFSAILSNETGCVEKSYMRPYKGLMLKGKVDYECIDSNGEKLIVDWKTTSQNFKGLSTSFKSKAYGYNYDRQQACYKFLTDATRFIFVAFDLVGLSNWKVFEVKDGGDFDLSGRRKLKKSVETAKTYLEFGTNHHSFRYEIL